MLTRAPSAEFSGLTLRARARPAGTRDWLERACPAAAASATHHGRVPTHAVTRREGRGLCSPHWARKPRRGRAKAAAGYSSLALPTRGPPRIPVPLGVNPAGSKPGPELGVPGWPEQTREASSRPQRAACTAGDQAPSPHIPRRRRVPDRSSAAKSGSSRGESRRPAHAGGRELSRRSSTAPSGPRRGLSPPAGNSRNSAAKVAWQDSSPLPPLPSLSLPGRRKVALGVPESLDHPHRARAAPSLGRAHARAGSGAQPQQSARGGKGAASLGGSAALKLLLPPLLPADG